MTKKKQPNDTAPVGRTAELRVERMALADMRPHPRNPRHHPDPGTPAWDSLRASLEHDYFDPLVVNVRPGPEEFMLVSGHLRRKVLIAAGYTHADVAVVDYDSATHLARLLAANKQQGDDIDSEMVELLRELSSSVDFDVALTGFELDDITALIADPPVIPSKDQNENPGGRMNRDGKMREVVAVGRWIGTAPVEQVSAAYTIVERIGQDAAAERICQFIIDHEDIFSR